MNVNIDESNSNNTKIKKIDKLLSKLPNSFDPKMIGNKNMNGFSSFITIRFNQKRINKIENDFLF